MGDLLVGWKMKKYFLLLAFLFSCAGPSMLLKNPDTNLPIYQCRLPIKVYLDRSVPNYDYYTIENELEYWNQELNTKIFVFKGYQGYSSSDYSLIIHAFFKSNEPPQRRGRTWFFLSDSGCIISSDIEYQADRINRNYRVLDWVFRHEMMHVLGGNHLYIENDLMAPLLPFWPTFVPRANLKQIKAIKNLYNLE